MFTFALESLWIMDTVGVSCTWIILNSHCRFWLRRNLSPVYARKDRTAITEDFVFQCFLAKLKDVILGVLKYQDAEDNFFGGRVSQADSISICEEKTRASTGKIAFKE
jgi:hypothetical protein